MIRHVTLIAVSLATLMLPDAGLAQSAKPAPQSAGRLARVTEWAGYITEASRRFGVPHDWIEGVMLAESGGQTRLNGAPIRSRVGAIGLMQLMPATYEDMRLANGLGANPDDPRDNILAGTAYLRAMYDRYGYPGLFAAYNAGPARYEASLRGEKLPFETRSYLAQLTGKVPSLASGISLFIDLSGAEPEAKVPASPSLFVVLNTASSSEN